MTIQRTLSIIKPDATKRNIIGKIVQRFEDAGLSLVATKLVKLSRAEAEQFYDVHRSRPFFEELVTMMISGPVFISVLEGENAVMKNREIMGATDPSKADAGTIRKDFALSIGENSVHGSDSEENAATEVAFFFPELNR